MVILLFGAASLMCDVTEKSSERMHHPAMDTSAKMAIALNHLVVLLCLPQKTPGCMSATNQSNLL
jgi:hypothetical protein